MDNLKYRVTCPACGKVHRGKRRDERDIVLKFICSGKPGRPCNCHFTVNVDPGRPWREAEEKFIQGEDIKGEFY